MGFGEVWMNWMKALVFTSHMSVLDNGRTTKEFIVARGLRQGFPLSPFLYVIVTELLTCLVKKAVQVDDFKGIDVKGRCKVGILQFSDDGLLIGEGSWKQV